MAPGIVYKDNRYTVVFKNEVTEDTVMKYMDDIVDAGGRLTQSFDPASAPAIPESHLRLLNKNTTDIDYIEPEGLPKRG
ncbi:hypothetical protein BJV77DRAFT_1067604 [Russula vinacea]|nr:hypothetical protein BJV77DRAFT_1067604 [Russula vinacea]